MTHNSNPAHSCVPDAHPTENHNVADPESRTLLQEAAKSGADLGAARHALAHTREKLGVRRGALRKAKATVRTANGALELVAGGRRAARRAIAEGHTRERELKGELARVRERSARLQREHVASFGLLEQEHAAALAVLARVVGAVLDGGEDGVGDALDLLDDAGLLVPESVEQTLEVAA